mmetsp:Transcript_18206/g.42552  ORF Transcript_18206/g.42552 Transcript_18206/m.42552 type:complete len:346 (-) Transcript_18206:147-1184(-)
MAAVDDATTTTATTTTTTTPAAFPHPLIYGTMESTKADAHLVTAGVCAAVRAGYRALDLAEHYESSKGGHIGAALDQLVAEVPRSELWLTHKIDGMPTGEYAAVKARVDAMLALAHTDYLDLLLIHYPMPRGTDLSGDPAAISTAANFEAFAETIGDAWTNMVKLKEEGLVRHIGVSNFYRQHLDELAKHAAADGPTACFANEIFVDAAHPETSLVEYCQGQGMQVMAYRPTAFCMNLGLLDGVTDALQATAEDRGLGSVQQLVLRTLCLRGVAPITGTRDPGHMASNIEAATSIDRGAGVEGGADAGAEATADLALVEEQAEMVDMMGGCDEYAAAFASMGRPE